MRGALLLELVVIFQAIGKCCRLHRPRIKNMRGALLLELVVIFQAIGKCCRLNRL